MSAAAMAPTWTAIQAEALDRFRQLLRIDTTNPPGNEIEAVRFVAELLKAHGIEYEIIETAPGRANLIARLKGTGKAGGPLLLSSHLDVVPADAETWTCPPFAAEIRDGFVWGRGAIDMKHMSIYGLTAMLLLKQLGAPLQRDLILAAVADEEAGCDFGMRWLVENRPELVRAEYALNEVGGFTLHAGQRRLYPVQVAEKGFVWVRMTMRGRAGHGSMPHKDNPVVKLASVLNKLANTRLPVRPTAVVDNFLKKVGQSMGGLASFALAGVRFAPLTDLLIDRLPDQEQRNVFNACLHNTVCPTVFEGGGKINVIPGSASVLMDCRTIPGASEADLIAEIRAIVGDSVDLEILKSGPPAVVDPDTPLFRTIESAIRRHDPGAEVVPYMVVGFTDSKWLAQLGVTAYGFAPIRWPREVKFSELFHGRDERIPVEGFQWGLRTFFEVVAETCGVSVQPGERVRLG